LVQRDYPEVELYQPDVVRSVPASEVFATFASSVAAFVPLVPNAPPAPYLVAPLIPSLSPENEVVNVVPLGSNMDIPSSFSRFHNEPQLEYDFVPGRKTRSGRESKPSSKMLQ
jgi:hypothetical protein